MRTSNTNRGKPSCPSSRCKCEGCRADRAAKRRRLRGSTGGPRRPAPHGSKGKYAAGCRCDYCVQENSERTRRYRLSGTTKMPEHLQFDETYGGLL